MKFSLFDAIATLTISPGFMATWCVLMVSMFGWYLLQLRRHASQLQKDTLIAEKLFSSLQQKKKKKDDLLAQLAPLGKDSFFANFWQTQLPFFQILDGELIQTSPVCTQENSEWILDEGLDIGTFSQIPQKLTGLGILATFIGLSASVYLGKEGISSVSLSSSQDSLVQILSSASFAFISSVCGILLSLLFSTLLDQANKSSKKNINALFHAINSKIPVATDTHLYLKHLDTQSRTTSLLENILEEMKTHSVTVSGAEAKAHATLTKSFEKALSQHIPSELQNISQEFKDSAETLQKTTKKFGLSLDRSIKKMTKLIDQPHTETHQETESIQLGAISLEPLEERLMEAASIFETGLNKATELMQTEFSEMTQSMQHRFYAETLPSPRKKPRQPVSRSIERPKVVKPKPKISSLADMIS